MDSETIILLGIIVVLILLSTFFSGSETALTAMSRARMHKRASEGNKKAKLALEIRENKDLMIGTILLGNTVVNIVGSMLAGVVVSKLFPNEGFGLLIATFLMTFLVLIFGEVMPKTYAIKNADKLAMKTAAPMRIIIILLSPITKLVQIISNFLLKIMGLAKAGDAMAGVDALRGAIDLHHSEGAVIKDDRDMLGSILDLSQIEVHEAMAPRREMVTISVDLPPAQIISAAIATEHSRIPIWEGEEENIIGILHAKNVLKLDMERVKKSQILNLLHEPQFIPETTTLRDQLQNFRARRSHMAIVVDEYGSLTGLITLEDILEEIVGQIDDEHDKVVRGVKRMKDGSFVVRGNLPIRDLNRELELSFPIEDDANTIAGFVIALAQQIPPVGTKVSYKKYNFKVLGKVRNQITSVRVSRKKKKKKVTSSA